MIKIAVVQECAHENLSNNLEITQKYASEAAQRGCSVICFPECYLTGYRPDKAVCNAISLNAPALQQVSKIATENAIDILVGFMEKSDDSFYITHGLFRKDGTRDYYRKTHLGQREKTVFSPGKELKILSLTNGTRIGIQLCVETHYPEITQTLALRGAEVVFAPHAVPRISGNREKIWSKYIPARSYDNRVYMACCNLWDDTRFGGGCMVTDPRGEITAACFEDHPALLVCEIDLELVDSFRNPGNKRSRHFYPAMRRQELYTEQSCVSHICGRSMTEAEMIQLAYDEGFAAAAIVDTAQIVFDPSFRPYCEENLCGQYGANYSCPPDCGSPEEMKQRVLAHKKALVLQTIWQVADYSDVPAIKQAKKSHNASEIRVVKKIREAGHDGLIVGASGCALCSPCAQTQGLPCNLPDLQYSCMSAYCIFVKKLADACEMEYDCGEGLLGLFGMYVFD